MPAERFDFTNAQGERLAGLLDNPPGVPRAYALFAHCFTCGKDVHAARRIAEGLMALGIAVLRFDFTGLGGSEGEFANTNFSSNVADLVAAADALRKSKRAPAILIGHSLGGAAVLAAAAQVPEARAVVTIAAPCDPAHVAGLFKDHLAPDRRARGGRGHARRPAVPHSPLFSRRRCRAEAAGADRRATQGAAHFSLAHRRNRRHRECKPHLCRGEASQELRLAGRRRSSSEPAGGCRLCRERHRRLGGALSRHAGDDARDGGARHGGRERDPRGPVPAGDHGRPPPLHCRRAGGGRRPRQRAGTLRSSPRRARRLHGDDAAHLCRGEIAAARPRHGAVSLTARFTPPTAKHARPSKACWTASNGRSPSRAISTTPSASGSSRSPTSARCTARSRRKSTSGRPSGGNLPERREPKGPRANAARAARPTFQRR